MHILRSFGKCQRKKTIGKDRYISIKKVFIKKPDSLKSGFILWERAGSNRRHTDFQSDALPTELHSLNRIANIGF